MAKIMDKEISKPRMINTTRCWVWEVITQEWDDHADDYVEEIQAVFFDPWIAAEWALYKYRIAASIQASIYHIDNCK